MIYIFRKRKQPTPGAMAYSFEPNFTLPLQSPIGAGIAVRQLRAIFQQPQVRSYIAVPQSGYGGLVAGQMVLQSLMRK